MSPKNQHNPYTSKPIIFIGFMGVGKTTIAKAYAKKNTKPYIDLDTEIEKQAQSRINEIFQKYGEQKFRELEHQALKKALSNQNAVIACGGGVVTFNKNQALLEHQEYCIWLKASVNYCLNQIEKETRPLLNTNNPLETARKLYLSREEKYQNLSSITIEVENKSIDQICKKIDDKIKQ